MQSHSVRKNAATTVECGLVATVASFRYESVNKTVDVADSVDICRIL